MPCTGFQAADNANRRPNSAPESHLNWFKQVITNFYSSPLAEKANTLPVQRTPLIKEGRTKEFIVPFGGLKSPPVCVCVLVNERTFTRP